MQTSDTTAAAKRPPRLSRRGIRLAIAGATVVAAGTAAVVGLGVGPAGATAAPTSPCAAVHILAARASTEAPGAGVIGSLVTSVQNASHQTVSTSSVNYPALLFPYDTSTTQGDTAIKSQLTAQVQNCPNQKIVLVGYSQGAQLVGDVLGGGGGVLGLGAATPPAAASITSHVVAVIQMGDPRRIPGQSFDLGNDPGARGLFPRQANQSLSAFANKIQSYCDTGDPFCAGGANVLAHLDYTTKYNAASRTFILGKIGG